MFIEQIMSQLSLFIYCSPRVQTTDHLAFIGNLFCSSENTSEYKKYS
jgi:hypothetical protein